MPTHLLLTSGADRAAAQTRVRHFFAKNYLVKYDQVTILAERTIDGGAADFGKRLQEGIAANRRVVAELLEELGAGGFEKLPDLLAMRQGYESKILHLISHLLDGFFGVDTVFYNLEEDSHGISDRLVATIPANPGGYWLVEAECVINTGHDPDQLDLIRRLEAAPSR